MGVLCAYGRCGGHDGTSGSLTSASVLSAYLQHAGTPKYLGRPARGRRQMTNRLAILLGALIIGAITWDVLRNDTAATVFMAQKGIELIEYLAFWR